VFFIPTNEFPIAYIRNLLGTVFTLFIPGFALMKCLHKIKLPTRVQSKELESIESFAMSIGLSIALISLIGITLYYSPFGFSIESITLSTFAVTLCLALLALYLESSE
jgi:uncharacterized membrane protein